MMIEDFTTASDDDGNEYLTFLEKRTKTRNEGLHPNLGQNNPKMFATNCPQCVVKLFKLFKSKRPAQCREKGRFYLQVIKSPPTEIWFNALPMGKMPLGNSENYQNELTFTRFMPREALDKPHSQENTC